MQRDFKGVWIPKEIWLDKDLTWMEKLFLTEINSLDNERGCFASNKYFAEFFCLTESRCSQIIHSLITKDYLKVNYIMEGKEIKNRVLNILKGGSKYIKGGIKYSKGGYLENAKDNNTILNNTDNNTKSRTDLFWLNMPDKFQDNDKFLEIWALWIDFNRERGTEILHATARIQLLYLSELKDPVNCIETAIANNWKGLKYENEKTKITNKIKNSFTHDELQKMLLKDRDIFKKCEFNKDTKLFDLKEGETINT